MIGYVHCVHAFPLQIKKNFSSKTLDKGNNTVYKFILIEKIILDPKNVLD